MRTGQEALNEKYKPESRGNKTAISGKIEITTVKYIGRQPNRNST
jgi:hypothetical protein